MAARPPVHRADRAVQRDGSREYERARAEEHRFYNRAAWRKLRALKLAINPLCEECEKFNQLVPATEVDHIIRRRVRPDLELDIANTQSLCTPCHSRKTRREDGDSTIILVCGPPGSGKTTYVRSHAGPDDLIVDLDYLLAAMTIGPMYRKPSTIVAFALAAYEAVIARLSSARIDGRAWVIATAAKIDERDRLRERLDAELVLLSVSADECKRRIAAQPERLNRGADWGDLVDQWWREQNQPIVVS